MSLLGSKKKVGTSLGNPSINLSQAMGKELVQAFTDVANVRGISEQFLELAKGHDTRQRMEALKPFIEANRQYLTQGFTSVLRFIDFKYQQNAYHYKVLTDAILKHQAAAVALEKSTQKEDQLALEAIQQKIATTQANSLKQLLGACEKMNLWHTLLTSIQTEEQMPGNTAKTIRKKLLDEISVVTGYLIQRLINAQLPKNDFYLIYQILDEKFTWFEQLIESYQKDLLTDFSSAPKDREAQSVSAENILVTYKNAVIFRTAFCDLASIETLKNKALAYCRSLAPFHSQLDSFDEKVADFKSHLEDINSMMPDVKQHSWLPIFSAVNDYFKRPSCNNLDLALLQQQAQELKEKVSKAQQDEKVPAEFVQTSVLTLLKLIAKPVPASEAKLLLGLTMEVMKLMQHHPSLETRYVGPCLKSALKKVADELLSEAIKAPAQATLAKPTVQVTDIAISELSAQMSSMTLHSETTAAHKTMQSLAQQAHEQELAKSITDSKQEHIAATRSQKKRLKKERKNLEKQLKDQREKALESQKTAQANERAEKERKYQDTLKQLRESEERKLKDEQQAILEQHQATMALLDKEHQAKLLKEQQRLKEEEQKKIKALKSRLAKEHAAKEAANEAELEKLAKESAQSVATASSVLQISHLQAIDVLDKGHAAKQDELVKKVRNMKRATDGFKPIETVALPLEVGQDLLNLDNTGIEAYLRGGWVRDRLLGLPLNPRGDIDVIVRCAPSQFRQLFPSSYVQNPLEPRQFTHGKVDFWCSEWDEITKEPCDFTINSFICDLNGRVFDLRNCEKHLQSPFLHVCDDNAKKSFEADPIRMLRMLRLAPQVAKGIEENDCNALLECANLMTNVKMGIYLKNIQQLFINPYSLIHLEQIIQRDLLRSIFPRVVNPPFMLKRFWDYKLSQYAESPESYDYYHVLALFLLQPLLSTHTNGDNIPKIQQCIETFITAYLGEKNDEVEKVRKATLSLLSDQPSPTFKLGLITEYDGFVRAILEEQHRQAALALVEQQKAAQIAATQNEQTGASPVTFAGYQRSRRSKQNKPMIVQPQKQSKLNGKH